MEITLYKNCPIPDDYKVVWNNYSTSDSSYKTAHTKLLDSLTKTTVSIADIYLDDTGELVLDLEDVNNAIWFIDYNYMSYELQVTSNDTHKTQTSTVYTAFNNSTKTIYKNVNYLQRYAFIDKIEHFNDCIKIYYKSDIWSTYAPYITEFGGVMTRYSDIILYYINNLNKYAIERIPHSKLPIDYYSYNPLIKYNLSGSTIASSLTGNQQCYCIVTMQLYSLSPQGETTDRYMYTCFIAHGVGQYFGDYDESSFKTTVDDWNTRITELMIHQNESIMGVNLYYEIQDVYYIPVNLCTVTDDYNFGTWITNLLNNTDFPLLWTRCWKGYVEITPTNTYCFLDISTYCDDNNYVGKPVLNHSFNISSGHLQNNYLRYAIGFYTHFIPIEHSNTLNYLDYNIKFCFDCANIKIYLELNNKIIELTEDLHIKIPIQVATADVTQLQAISREIASKKNVTNAVAGGTQSVLGTIAGLISGNVVGAVSSAVSGVQSTVNAVLDNQLINAEVYTTNKSIEADSTGFVNAYYGLMAFNIDSVNTPEVQDAINKYGYIICEPKTAQFLDNFYLNGVMGLVEFTHYRRYIQYRDVYLTGTFSQQIRNKLKSIIETGVKFIGNDADATNYLNYV